MAITNNNFIILDKDGVKVQMRKDKLSARGKNLELFELVDNQSGVSYECALPFVVNGISVYNVSDVIGWIDCGIADCFIELDVTAGLFDFSYSNVGKWVFADGSESTDERPAITLTGDQTVKLYVTDYGGELNSNSTGYNYVGDISALANLTHYASFHDTDATGDIAALANLTHTASFYNTNVSGDIAALANLTHYASFYNTNVTGDIAALANLTHYASFHDANVSGDIGALSNLTHTASFYNTNVTGDIAALSSLTYYASFSNTNVSGDISALSNLTYRASFYNTNVTGVLNPKDELSYIYLNGTSMSEEDTMQSLISMNDNFMTTKTRTIQLKNNVNTSDPEVIALVTSLGNKGCTVTFV